MLTQTSEAGEAQRGEAVRDLEYDDYLAYLQGSVVAQVNNGREPIFTTDAANLFETYLAAIPASERQHYNCHACRELVRRFGGLVTIDEGGRLRSLFWGTTAPALLEEATTCLNQKVRRAKVTGVFLSSSKVWGQPMTAAWHHLAVTPPPAAVYVAGIKDAGQAMAEKHEDFLQIIRALEEFSERVLQQAVTLLTAEQLYRSEKVLGPVQWLRDLQVVCTGVRGSVRTNRVWRAVALAPPGFCHPRSGMAGTLLEDLAAGLPFSTVAERFAQKMHPLRYQRPQAAPSAGNIEQAEKVVERLGLGTALKRRFARLEEVPALWRPASPQAPSSREGVFGHLAAKGERRQEEIPGTPAVRMTWEKFQRTVLPHARTLECYVGTGHLPFMALVTAVDPEAPPLLQWDTLEKRNPISWYFWNNGSPASQWGLLVGKFYPVTAVALYPSMWGEDNTRSTHQGKGVTFFIEGMRETRSAGLALFPEKLRNDLHAVRATIEAFSRAGELEGMAEGSACGLGLSAGQPWDARLRVRTASGVTEYALDRWD